MSKRLCNFFILLNLKYNEIFSKDCTTMNLKIKIYKRTKQVN